jgi:signal transduction histidine kinase/DNA-binding response OmpR family regulator
MRTCNILHVEDSPDDAELVRQALRRAVFACEIERVDTEPAFCAQLDGGTPDVIICDYDMPRFSAERALQIREERGLEVPFIVVSHHIDQSAAVIAMQQGASDYLSKRDLSRLPKAIAAAVDRAQARAERAKARQALAASEAMMRGILESLNSRIAVIDPNGVILATNRTWEAFELVRAESGIPSAAVGVNYLTMLGMLAERGNAFAGPAVAAVREVISGERPFASLDYQFPINGVLRWFLARAVRMEGSDNVVVSHQDISDTMMAHMALEDAHRRLQALSKRVLSIQEEERRALSRELHDDIGQTLAAMKIGLHRMAASPPEEARALLPDCLQAADEALERMRALAQQLRPPQLDQLGLQDALAWLGETIQRATGAKITVEGRGLSRRPPPSLEIACYRIAQEAMNNATRHGKASNIKVAIEADERLLKLSVRDDGAGFDEAAARDRAIQAGSLGIVGMEERAQLAGGRLKIRSVPGDGTVVTATFAIGPLAAMAQGEALTGARP